MSFLFFDVQMVSFHFIMFLKPTTLNWVSLKGDVKNTLTWMFLDLVNLEKNQDNEHPISSLHMLIIQS